MATINFFLQGKGGCGKSTCAIFYAQYLLDSGVVPICLDNDPVNASLMSYGKLNGKAFNLLDENNDLRKETFDQIIDEFLTGGKDDVFIADNGATVFSPLISYMVSERSVRFLKEEGHSVYIHCPIGGGAAIHDMYNGFKCIAEAFPDSNGIILWMNRYLGEAIDPKGIAFLDSNLYKKFSEVVTGIINLPIMNDLEKSSYIKMAMSYMTFEEACSRMSEKSPLNLIQKSRMNGYREKLYNAIFEGLAPKQPSEDENGQS